MHLSNSVYGLILVHVIQGLSFTTLFCRNYYVNIPDDLIKAARIDGAGFWRIFFKIILPLSPPILIVTVIWQFTGIWNEFLFGVVFTGGTQQPITAALVALATSQMNAHPYDVASAAVMIGAVPPLLIYLFGGKYFVRGLTQARSNDRATMATLTVSRLLKRFGSVEVLKGIDLEAQTGSSSRSSAPPAAASRRCWPSSRDWKAPARARFASTEGWSIRSRRRTATSPWCSSPTRSTRR